CFSLPLPRTFLDLVLQIYFLCSFQLQLYRYYQLELFVKKIVNFGWHHKLQNYSHPNISQCSSGRTFSSVAVDGLFQLILSSLQTRWPLLPKQPKAFSMVYAQSTNV